MKDNRIVDLYWATHPARISEEMAGYPPGQAWRRRSVPCP